MIDNLKQKNNFKFGIHKHNFLSKSQCGELIKRFESSKQEKATIAGTYEGEGSAIVNENVRKVLEVRFDDDLVLSDGFNVAKSIISAIKIANVGYFEFDISDILTKPRILKYSDTKDKYDWHLDIGNFETSLRKITASIQLSNQDDYEGGNLELSMTENTGKGTAVGSREQGTLVLFPSFVGHRVLPVTKGVRYSLIGFMLGNAFK